MGMWEVHHEKVSVLEGAHGPEAEADACMVQACTHGAAPSSG